MTKSEINKIANEIISCAIKIHNIFGPGLLESVYHVCMISELKSRGYEIKQKHHVPLFYEGEKLASKLKLDLLVNDQIIVELKSVDAVNPIYIAQLLTYMKLAQKPKGLLINFDSVNIIAGSIPLVNEIFASLPD